MPWVGMQLVIVLFPDHTHLLIATVYLATVLRNGITQRLVSMPDKWFYAAGKWFFAAPYMQLAATCCSRIILHFTGFL